MTDRQTIKAIKEILKEKGLPDSQRIWSVRQALADPGRYYGDGGTWHDSTVLNVEQAQDGRVVAVWFRCMMLDFDTSLVDSERAKSMDSAQSANLLGVEIIKKSGYEY